MHIIVARIRFTAHVFSQTAIMIALTACALVAALALAAVQCQLTPISDEDITIRLSLAMCVATASEEYFEEYEIITISLGPNITQTEYSETSSLDGMLLPELFNKGKWTILLKQPREGRPTLIRTFLNYRRSDSYVLQLRSWQEINVHIMYLQRHPSWNPHAKFIVISATSYDNVERIIEYLIKKLWEKDVLNGVILFPAAGNSAEFNIYTWLPYADGSCGDHFNRIEKLGSCYFGQMNNTNTWFPNKMPTKMNNCSVKVRTLDYPPFIINPTRIAGKLNSYRISKGLEVQLMNMVSKVANLFMEYEIIARDDWGEIRRPHNTSTGIVGALVRGEADIGMASMSATIERHSMLDSTSAYFQDSIGFCVPHAVEKSQWEKLTEIMTTAIWIATFVTMVIITIIIKALANINKSELPVYTDCISVGLKVIAISVGNTINIQPASMPVRLFLFLWIVFSLHLDTAYQTYLMSTLTDIEFEYQISNVEDILASDLDLLFMPNMANYFSNDSSKYSAQTQEIMARWTTCNNLDDCLKRTAYKRDCVIAVSRLYMQYAKSSFISKTGQPLLYCLEDSIVSFSVVAYMRRGFPMQQKLDNIINAINSAGFVQRFEWNLFKQKFAGGFKNDSYSEDDFLDVDKVKVLTFSHMYPIFMLLLFGYGLCVTVYFIEIIVYKYKKKS